MSWPKFYKFPAYVVVVSLLLSGCFDENVMPLEIDAKAPPSVLTLLDGEPREITNHPGQAQIITFMASWCPCSNESIPLIKKVFEQYGKGEESKIEFLMIGIQSAERKFKDIAHKWQIPFIIGYDDGDKIARTYGITAPPTTVFVDADGVVKRVFYGNIKDKEEEFLRWTRDLL